VTPTAGLLLRCWLLVNIRMSLYCTRLLSSEKSLPNEKSCPNFFLNTIKNSLINGLNNHGASNNFHFHIYMTKSCFSETFLNCIIWKVQRPKPWRYYINSEEKIQLAQHERNYTLTKIVKKKMATYFHWLFLHFKKLKPMTIFLNAMQS